MKKSSKLLVLGLALLLAALCLVMIALPVFATNGDYGINSGGGATNTPAATSTPTCTDGNWGQEENGAWVCIANPEPTNTPFAGSP